MNLVAAALDRLNNQLGPTGARLVAVSKYQSDERVRMAYEAGQRIFAENRVQELLAKKARFPSDIEWHFIGHLQSNKVRMLLPAVGLIHSVDSPALLEQINHESLRMGLQTHVLLQVHIAQEEHKFGLKAPEVLPLLNRCAEGAFAGVRVGGLMGMASLCHDDLQIGGEFSGLSTLFNEAKSQFGARLPDFNELSMGMSGDYALALQHGSTLVRMGSALFEADALHS
ncbi:MAG: YggS family pyridoxal phosphate-dependent enzyme [Bacteroidota bacterium]